MVTLIKGSQRKEFTEKAAKILVEAYGWSEFVPLKKPVEIGHKTLPPIIEAKKLIEPIKLVEPLKPIEPVVFDEVKKVVVEPAKVEPKVIKRRKSKKA